MIKTSIIGTIMNMTADVYIQQNVQSTSGTMQRKWIYNQTIPCKAMATASKAGRSIGDDKSFQVGVNGYAEDVHIKLQSPVLLSKRWRISGIKDSNNSPVFVESDMMTDPDTIFEIISNHPVLDPFGKVSYYEINLRRAVIQNNDTVSA